VPISIEVPLAPTLRSFAGGITFGSDSIAVVTRFITEFLGKGDLAVADATAHERVQGITGLKPTGPIDGREEYKATIAAFVDAFPAEGPLTILDQFASADGTRS
jgi:hypothetical protein